MTKCQTGRAVVLLFLVLVLFQSSATLAQDSDEVALVERKAIV